MKNELNYNIILKELFLITLLFSLLVVSATAQSLNFKYAVANTGSVAACVQICVFSENGVLLDQNICKEPTLGHNQIWGYILFQIRNIQSK